MSEFYAPLLASAGAPSVELINRLLEHVKMTISNEDALMREVDLSLE